MANIRRREWLRKQSESLARQAVRLPQRLRLANWHLALEGKFGPATAIAASAPQPLTGRAPLTVSATTPGGIAKTRGAFGGAPGSPPGAGIFRKHVSREVRMRFAVAIVMLSAPAAALSSQAPDWRQVERELLRELIEINTSDSAGRSAEAAGAMARRLRAAGLPAEDVLVIGFDPTYQNLVARYRGRGAARPVLLMAHLDVVDARPEDWSVPPYQLTERDGYYYGRGTTDNKAGAAKLVAAFLRFRHEGYVPDRDLIMVLTADEETTGESIRWLLAERRDLVDAEYALNTDAGGGTLVDGKPLTFSVQASEKMYVTYQFEVRNRGGHSSLPVRDNAIYHLSEALARLADHEFPVRLNEVSRAHLERGAATQPPDQAADMRAVARTGSPEAARRLAAADPWYNAVLRTTCVATRLYAGHADNALPQLARATVNCRLLPDESVESVTATLRRVVADDRVEIRLAGEPTPSPASPLRADIMEPIERLVGEMWPGAVVIPEMSTGATDGLYVRNAGIPTYGLSAIFEEMGDVRAHGRDERVGIAAYHDAAEFWYRMLRTLTGGRPGA
jgi:acetylornithine deacetylase/succinyl-diaminopimelate desuccinylase-like protein